MNNQNSCGILSLGGFAYQIKVFIYYMFQLRNESTIEFETIDDVVFKEKNILSTEIDDYEDNFRNLLKDDDISYNAIQVKRTNLTKGSKEKLIWNWILLEKEKHNQIKTYTLFTPKEYENQSNLFDYSPKELYERVVKSKSKENALISKVKKIFMDKAEDFLETYEMVKSKFSFIEMEDLDRKIHDGFSNYFLKGGVSDDTYFLRLESLIRNITGEIICSVNAGESYILTHRNMMKKISNICDEITDDEKILSFSDFKKMKNITLNDIRILNSREYKQLLSCEITEDRIINHLLYQEYYLDARFGYLENGKVNLINDIEEVSYDNFLDVKEILKNEGDTPIKRLIRTKERLNSYAKNEHVKNGSYIYLTSAKNGKKIISWKDEINGK